jgi:hypothetical protein
MAVAGIRFRDFELCVQYLLKVRIAELEKQPLLGNGYVTLNIGAGVRSCFFLCGPCRCYYKEDQPQLRESPETEDSRVGVRWPPACEDLSSGTEERPPLEAVTEQHSEC